MLDILDKAIEMVHHGIATPRGGGGGLFFSRHTHNQSRLGRQNDHKKIKRSLDTCSQPVTIDGSAASPR